MGAFKNKSSNKKNKLKNIRKEIRKEKRKLKRSNRNAYYTNKNKKNADVKNVNENKTKKISNVKEPNKNPNKILNKKLTFENNVVRDICKEKKQFKYLENEMLKNRKKQLQEDIEMEDESIKKLEKQLNIKNKKTISKSFVEDGLDYVLDLCDPNVLSQKAQTEKQLVDLHNLDDSDNLSGSENESSDLDSEPNSENIVDSEFEETMNDSKELSEEEEDDNILDDDFVEDELSDNNDLEDKDMASENMQFSSDDNTSNISNDEMEFSNSRDTIEQSLSDSDNYEEDIYGRKRDKHKNIVEDKSGKYIPPQIRARMLSSEQSEKLQQLRRQIKSLLNKLTEKNISSISKELEVIYMNNSHNDTNDLLTNLSLEFLVQVNSVPDIMMAHYAMLISILHANVGSDIGAYFLQNVVKKFSVLLLDDSTIENKRLENLTSVLSHLYNFKIFSSLVLLDILIKLSENLNEKQLDCILIILRVSGFFLRKESPGELKDVILKLQTVANTAKSNMKQSSRVKFLVDILLAIKNNNFSKVSSNFSSQSQELQKQVKNFYRKGNYVSTLNVRLDDMLKADEHGRWWSVGSAWSGCNKNIAQHSEQGIKNTYSDKLLELAKKQRMNTEARKNIFCAIMSAEDYLNAFQKVLSLSLKGNQEQEVVHVLISCCLQEQKYNPYYSLLAQKFCEFDRKFRISFQYSLWDKIKDLSSLKNNQLTILGKFMLHMLKENGLSLCVLKIIDFSELQICELKLIKQILFGILLDSSEDIVKNIFEKISRSPKLKMFRQSLRLFLHHLLLGNKKSTKRLDENSKELLDQRIKIVNQILTIGESKLYNDFDI